MTTFFRTEGRQTVDCWSVRMASFRTDHILAVRRLDGGGPNVPRSSVNPRANRAPTPRRARRPREGEPDVTRWLRNVGAQQLTSQVGCIRARHPPPRAAPICDD